MTWYNEELIGKRFGRLLVISFNSRKPEKSKPNSTRPYWNCICDCGNIVVGKENSLKRGLSTSCGCYRTESIKKCNTKHGLSYSRQHKIWTNMKTRCNNPKIRGYKDYGGRSISYDPKWETFGGFWEDMEEGYSDSLTLERRDTNKNYCKENCTWVSPELQPRNQRKKSSNKTGVNGVSFNEKIKIYTATWYDLSGRNHSKSFSINKYGEELAFFMACEYREHQIALLNLQGAGYSEDHGK